MSKKTIFCLTVLTLILLASSSSSQRRGWGSWPNWLTKETEDRSPVAVWRADYGVTTVDTGGTYPTVSNWLSTNGLYNAVQSTASRRPLYNTDSVALKFDGVDDYLFYDASSPNIFDPRTDDFSVAAWIYIPIVSEVNGKNQCVLSKGNGGSTGYPGFNFNLRVEITNNRIVFDYSVSASTNTIARIIKVINNPESAWYHAVVSADRDGELIMYIDGVIIGSIDISAYKNDDVWSSYPFKIGTVHSNVNFYHSYIAEIRYYKVALTQSEVEALYNAGRPR